MDHADNCFCGPGDRYVFCVFPISRSPCCGRDGSHMCDHSGFCCDVYTLLISLYCLFCEHDWGSTEKLRYYVHDQFSVVVATTGVICCVCYGLAVRAVRDFCDPLWIHVNLQCDFASGVYEIHNDGGARRSLRLWTSMMNQYGSI